MYVSYYIGTRLKEVFHVWTENPPKMAAKSQIILRDFRRFWTWLGITETIITKSDAPR